MLEYVDQPYKRTYDLLKIVDEETIIGKAYIGKFPKGREIGSSSMSRQYDLDFMGEEDFFMLFNSKKQTYDTTSEDVNGSWNVKFISDFIPPVYQRALNIDLNKNDLKRKLIRAISEGSSKENEKVDDLTEFHNQLKMVTRDFMIGNLTSPEYHDRNRIHDVKSNIDTMLLTSLTLPEVSGEALELNAYLRSNDVKGLKLPPLENLPVSSLEEDGAGRQRINVPYVLQRVT